MIAKLLSVALLSTAVLAVPLIPVSPALSYSVAAPVAKVATYAAAPIHGYAAPIHSYAAPIAAAAYHHPAPVVHAAPAAYVHAAPAIAKVIAAPEPIDPNPKYSFAYGVTDPHTGDSKNAEEHLENGVIHGSYSLVEPDGHVRKVTYTADHVNGFNAVVERTGGPAKVAVAPAVAVAKVVAAPIAHHAAHTWI